MEATNFCIAGRLRMLSRVITTLYNEAFAAEGVTFAQASLLMHIFALPAVRQVELSRRLQIEKSALSRDIQLLQKRGWITDNVRRGLYLTEEGTAIAKRCHKIWKGLHERVRTELGEKAIGALDLFSQELFAVQTARKGHED
ncbi:MarR family winged helix-turn-helix transcriptional regulator [Tellurirhabdus rosea]|uniref:MarR family winged helix-turn-helix transcriptional regulator n=1 Tax=Tellurirhabdus rosea TaxID=2674997 RepID=UPI00224FB6A2|nr:MarR family transcriptional regulator [Tellurirhabdus rosea]